MRQWYETDMKVDYPRTPEIDDRHQDEIFGSAYAAAVYISSVMKLPKDKKAYVIGMSGIEEELREEGVAFIGGTVRPLQLAP